MKPSFGCRERFRHRIARPGVSRWFDRLHQQGNTIVLVTHEHDIAMHAHRIVHRRDGKIEKDERIK